MPAQVSRDYVPLTATNMLPVHMQDHDDDLSSSSLSNRLHFLRLSLARPSKQRSTVLLTSLFGIISLFLLWTMGRPWLRPLPFDRHRPPPFGSSDFDDFDAGRPSRG